MRQKLKNLLHIRKHEKRNVENGVVLVYEVMCKELYTAKPSLINMKRTNL